MASSHGHGTGKQNEAREARRERNRTGGEVNPAAVAAVIQFGYAPDLVMSTCQRLLSTRAKDSQHATLPPPESGASNRTGSASPRDISASTLLTAVDDAIRHANLAGDVAFNSSFAAPSETAGFASSLVVTGTEGDGMTHIGDLQDGGSSDGDAASSRNTSDQNQMVSNTAVNHPQSSTSSQSPISNMEGTTSSKESVPVTTPSAEGQADTEAAPPLTSSDDVRRNTRSPEGRSPTSVITAGETSHPNAASSAVEASAAVAARESPAAASSQGAESGSGSRDRSSDRRENMSAEEKSRERRHQLNRLRALRAEHRQLKARQTCLHCRKNPVTLTLLPCGHFIFCQECGSSFDACPICRKTILADVRTFLS